MKKVLRARLLGAALMLGPAAPALGQDATVADSELAPTFFSDSLGAGSYAYRDLAVGAEATFGVQASDRPLQVDIFSEPASPTRELAVAVWDTSAQETLPLQFSRNEEGTLRFTLPQGDGGNFGVVVRDASGSGGRVSILVRELPDALADVAATPLELSSDEQRLAVPLQPREPRYYSMTVTKGTLLRISMQSEADELTDPILRLYAGDQRTGEVVAWNDDSEGGLDSLLVYPVPEDGTYTLRAAEVEGKPGSFRLAYQVLQQGRVEPVPLSSDRPVRSELTRFSPVILDSGRQTLEPYAFFGLADDLSAADLARAGEKLRIRLESADFDPFLEIGFDSPFGFSVVASNDDSGSLASEIDIDPATFVDRFPADETEAWWQLLRIRGYALSGGLGSYTLTLTRLPSTTPATAAAL